MADKTITPQNEPMFPMGKKPDPTKPKPRWIAKGSKYHDPRKDERHENPGEEKITIRECDKEIHMSPPGHADNQVYGQAIDARLAIHFIRNLWRELDRGSVFELYRKTKNFLQSKDNNSDDFSFLEKEEKRKLLETFICLIDLLRYSSGLTVSRSMLLKILSQPESRGVRFYLALKNPKDSSSIADLQDGIFTLVMVGVDDTGTDLHYEYHPEKHTKGDQIPDVDTTSLAGEYPAPSGAVSDVGPTFDEANTQFPLWKYAMYK